MKKNSSKHLNIDSEEESKNEFFYEVVLYRIYPDRAETLDGRFYKTTSPYKGKDCIIKDLKDSKIIKLITPINL